jgi:hypothetical protein
MRGKKHTQGNPRTWKSGNSLLKSDVLVDGSKRSKKELFAPTPTLRSVVAVTHDCVLVVLAVDTLKVAEASRFRNKLAETMPPSADSPTSSSGMRWPVAPNFAPLSEEGEIVTSVVGFQVELIRAGLNMAKVKARLTLGAWRDST